MRRNETLQTNALSPCGRKSPEKEPTFFPMTTTTRFWAPFSGISKRRNRFHLTRKKEEAPSRQTLRRDPWATQALTERGGSWKRVPARSMPDLTDPRRRLLLSQRERCLFILLFAFHSEVLILHSPHISPPERTLRTPDRRLKTWPRRPLLWTGHASHGAGLCIHLHADTLHVCASARAAASPGGRVAGPGGRLTPGRTRVRTFSLP